MPREQLERDEPTLSRETGQCVAKEENGAGIELREILTLPRERTMPTLES